MRKYHGDRGKLSILIISLAFLIPGFLTTSPRLLRANSTIQATLGDALAVFKASYTGGFAIRAKAGTIEGAPAAFSLGSLGAIRPFPPFNGRHYCEYDWHVLTLTILTGPPVSPDFQSARENLNSGEVNFWVDGDSVDVMETNVRPVLIPILPEDPVWAMNHGQIFAPTDLAAGPHTFRAEIVDEFGDTFFDNTITFHIDPPDEGRCLPENR